jgi:hypothetical protein
MQHLLPPHASALPSRRNKDFSRLISSDYLADPGHCPLGPGPSRRLLGSDEDFQPKLFLEAAGLCTGVSIAGALLRQAVQRQCS